MVFLKAFLNSKRGGQSLIEVLIASALGAVMITAAVGAIVPAMRVTSQTNKSQAGTALAKELLENVRVWAENDWHNISGLTSGAANHYYLNATTSPFTVSAGEEQVAISTTTYTRYFYVSDVSRDAGDVL